MRPSLLHAAPLSLLALLLLGGFDARLPGSATAPAGATAGGLVADTVVVFVVWGTSNGTNVGDGALSPDPLPGTAWEWYWRGTQGAAPLDDPFVSRNHLGHSADGGSAWPQFAITYHGATGHVVFMSSVAEGGSATLFLPDHPAGYYADGLATITGALDAAEALLNKPAVFGGVLWNASVGMSYDGDVWQYYPWDLYRDDFRVLLDHFGEDVHRSTDPRIRGGRFYFINTLIPKHLAYPDPYTFALDAALDLEADVCSEFAYCSMVQVSEQIKAAHDACIAGGGGTNCDWYQDSGDFHWGQDGLDVVGEATAAAAAAHLHGDPTPWDVAVEVPNPRAWCASSDCDDDDVPAVRLDVYGDDGVTLVHSTPIAPSVASPDWTASFAGAPGAAWTEESWADLETDFLTLYLVVERNGLPDEPLARYVYVPTARAFGPAVTNFYRPVPQTEPMPVLLEVAVADAATGAAEVRARNGAWTPIGGVAFEDVFGGAYVVPYNHEHYRATCAAWCPSEEPGYFLARLPEGAAAPTATTQRYAFASGTDVAIPPDWGPLSWEVPGLALAFAPGTRLYVKGGSLSATGVTLTAVDPAQGWGGVTFLETSTGAFSGVTVEDVVGPPGRVGDAAVEVFGAAVTLSGSIIRDGQRVHGLWASGDDALVTLDQFSEVRDMAVDGAGVVAAAGAEVRIYDSTIAGNAYVGVGATGMGSLLYLHDTQVTAHGAYGVVAEASGEVRFGRHDQPTLVAGVEVSFSARGGLYAFAGGDITAGIYNDNQGACTAGCQNALLENWTAGNDFDAKAGRGSVVFAEYNTWGLDRTLQDLELYTGGNGMLNVTPLWTGGAPRLGDGGEPESGNSVASHLDAAYTAAAEGNDAAAAARLLIALRQAQTDDERDLAYGAAARFSSENVPPGLEAQLQAHLAPGTEARPWALTAMLAAHRTEGQTPEAWATASSLSTEYAGTDHALPGLSMTARLAAEADDLPSAQAALADLQVGWPDLLATESAAVLVRRLEEGADVRLGGLAGPAVATFDEPRESPATGFQLHGVRPNPFAGRTVVPFELITPSRVRLAVYDVLGREVAVLADGPFEAGAHVASLDGRGLAAGLYLVQAWVEASPGTRRSFSQRITLVR